MMLCRNWKQTLVAGALAVASMIGVAPRVLADAFTYSANTRQVKVGIVIPSDWRGQRTTSPNLFYALDRRTDLKPSGWNIVNPMAPDRIDAPMARRWNQSGNSNPAVVNPQNPYKADNPLSKNMGGYWEVPLDTATPAQLSEFDLLYLCPPAGTLGGTNLSLSPVERDKLRKAVDAGAILWVERPTDATTVTDFNLFLAADFSTGVSTVGQVGVAQPLHPLLNSPYILGNSELNSMFGGIPQKQITQPPRSLDPIAISRLLQDAGGKVIVAAGDYGSGYVVLSSMIGEMINTSTRQGTESNYLANNRGGFSGNDLTNIPISALKFAYNVMSANQESPQERRVPRRTASTNEEVGAPLTRKWTYPDGPNDPHATDGDWKAGNLHPNSAAPAVFKGIVYVPAADGWLYAFDLDPMRDLDNDGNPDDGQQDGLYDLSRGAPYDILWKTKITAGGTSGLISTPTVATVNIPGRGPVDVVYVSTEDGKMYAFEALPQSNGRISTASPSPLWTATLGDAYPLPSGLPIRIPAPVFGEGRLFACGVAGGSEGIVMELDPANGKILWKYQQSAKPANTVPPSIGVIVATPTLAWVNDDATDAKDLVLYVPSFAESTRGQTARIFSFLLSVRGERLQDSGDRRTFRSRYWLNPTNLPWSTNYVIHAPPGITATPDLNSPGRVNLSAPLDPNSSVTITADYDLDTKADNYKPRSTFYGFPGSNGNYPNFISSPVLGPNDTLYAVAVDFSRNISSVYAFKDQSPIAFVKWRYTIQNAIVLGPPAYHSGAIYVGTDKGNIIGFDADPVFYIDVNAVIDEGRKFQLQIVQEDTSLPKAFQTVAFTYNQSQFDVANITDVDPVTRLTRVHMRVSIKSFSLSGSTALDAALPVRIRFPTVGTAGQSEESSEIKSFTSLCGDTASLFNGSTTLQANKLFDQSVVTGGSGSVLSGPTVAGDRLYLTSGDGNVYTIPSDPCALTGAGRFSSQVRTQIATDPPIRGLMVPVSAGNQPIRGPVVVSAGNLIANTPGGVMVFQQPVTLVTDASRILEVRNTYKPTDPKVPTGSVALAESEIVWSLTGTTQYTSFPQPGLRVLPGITGALPVPEKRSFAHPSSIVRESNTNFLVADTGNNRVVEVDRSGTVLWELAGFADPFNILGGAEPLTLNTPTDVQRWQKVLPGGAIELHTLIVDQGNHRLLEIRDTYSKLNSSNPPDYHVLVWASHTTQANSYYDFRSAQRVPVGPEGKDFLRDVLPPGDYTIATVANWRVNSVDGTIPDTPGSSLVILDGPKFDATGKVTDPGGRVVAFARTLKGKNGNLVPINNPTSFQRFFTGAGANQWRALLTDGQGFYEIGATMDTGTKEMTLQVVGSITANSGVGGADPRALGIVMAKRLPSGNTLVVNQAVGQIYEYDPLAGRFLTVSPATEGTHALAQPAAADRSF